MANSTAANSSACHLVHAATLTLHSISFYASISSLYILKGSLQPKLTGANVWPFNACGKVATG